MPDAQEVLKRLEAKASSKNVEGMAKFGMTPEKRLGVSVPEVRRLAKEVGRDHNLALELWETGVLEARIVAGMVAEPEKLTEKQMENRGCARRGKGSLFSALIPVTIVVEAHRSSKWKQTSARGRNRKEAFL
ncbi:MAG: DNA alkylation repair protein [Deltaproteobacteria bacterium]|nr:DNA alkylation repair protein [Deltaproteobacteria bacterium]